MGGASDEQRTLGDREREILAFERDWAHGPAAKEAAIRERFGISAARYYQVLNALIDSPEAVRQDPSLVKRLHRMRQERASLRTARRFAGTADAAPATRTTAESDAARRPNR